MKKTESMSDYQKDYREKNKEKSKAYQKEYRNNRAKFAKRGSKKVDVIDKNIGRIYICKLGDNRLKIGATHLGSQRVYHLKRKINLIGISFHPLYFIDFKDRNLVSEIEKDLKMFFCSPEVGINLNSFKNEVAQLYKLQDILKFIENKLISKNIEYNIICLK